MNKAFIPFREIKDKKVIIVDGLHPNQLVLSHWKGANTHSKIAADSSGEIVLNAIRSNFKGIDCELVSATHFDIDGFVGVFALFYPSMAIKYFEVLKKMAQIGDFREFDPSSEDSILACKLCCWMNTVEKNKFYRPFEEKDELTECVPKFEYFLPIFPQVLENINEFKNDWKEEFEQVEAGILQLRKSGPIEKLDHIGLVIKHTSDPIHYYTLFSDTEGYDIVLSIYDNQRYELEMKYTTWVDINRPTLPRFSLKPLANLLNQDEQSGHEWQVDKLTDTGPILRLEKEKLHKADRYANPNEREIYSSTIPPQKFKSMVIQFLSNSFRSIEPKKHWTWKEMKTLL